jgi:carboxylesterase
MTEVIPGAEDFRADGGPVGVLVLHGFTGNPSSMRGLAEAFAREGHTVVLPRLPGHGTTIADMMDTSWVDWSGAAEQALVELTGRSEVQFVVGLSMGGSIACWLASRHPELAGLVCINPAASAQDELRAVVREMLDAGETVIQGIGSDIADPDAVESAYLHTPIAPLLSLFEAAEDFGAELHRITQPMLLLNSVQDHVVPPGDSDHLAASVSGPVQRVTLERSYHVATQDYDKDLIIELAMDFVAQHSP